MDRRFFPVVSSHQANRDPAASVDVGARAVGRAFQSNKLARGGARQATRTTDGLVRVEMGEAALGPVGAVQVSVAQRSWPATAVHVPNPHAVAFVDDLADAGALTDAPGVAPQGQYPDGANVEFVVVLDEGRIAMRVHERGVGETLSCGTGACAAAVAHLAAAGASGASGASQAEVRVDVPGGTVRVTGRGDGTVALTGPVETVAVGRLAQHWLDADS